MKNILKIILFVVGLFIILLGLSKIFMPKNNTEQMGMDQAHANGILGEKNNTIDVVVLGDSESFTAIIPMELWHNYGFTTYNCGTSSQYLYETYSYLLKSIKNQKPKVAILETNAIFRNIPVGSLIGSVGKDMLPIFRYHNRWKKMTKADFKDKVKYTWSDDLKGFNYNKNILEVKDKSKYMSYTDEVEKIAMLNMYYLDKIVKTAANNDIKLIMLSTPSTINWNYKRHNAINQYAKEHNLNYIDLNLENIGIDWQYDTRDQGDHLNYQGALKVTSYMGNYLNNLHLLENHLTDPYYANWNVAYQKYEILVNR